MVLKRKSRAPFKRYEQGFQDGMQRLLKELKAQQIQDLVLKNSTVGLSNDENRLLVALISDRP